MIRDDMTPHRYRVTFDDAGVQRTHYTDDRRYFERLVAEHGHLSGLSVDPVRLTQEEQGRLDEIKNEGLSAHDAGVYVRYGTTETEDTGYYDAGKLEAFLRDCCEPRIKAQRQEAEAAGVTVNDVRYGGDPGNRQALSEAIQAAEDGGNTAFDRWKDSDGNYHPQHPVSDVKEALRRIGKRRSALIDLEAQYVADVAAGDTDILDLDWSTQYD